MRTLIALLLLANLAFFSWTQGWLDTVVGVRSIGDREPERLAKQVRPEAMTILPPEAAREPAAPPPALTSCLEAGPFADAELAAARSTVESTVPAAGIVAARADRAGEWMVYMGRYTDRDTQLKKRDELRRRGVAFEELRAPAALAPGLSLGRFDQRGSADQALDRLAQRGIRTARVVELAPAVSATLLRVEKADAALAAQLAGIKADALGKGFAACAVPPAGT
jgi:hypothetical protein